MENKNNPISQVLSQRRALGELGATLLSRVTFGRGQEAAGGGSVTHANIPFWKPTPALSAELFPGACAIPKSFKDL